MENNSSAVPLERGMTAHAAMGNAGNPDVDRLRNRIGRHEPTQQLDLRLPDGEMLSGPAGKSMPKSSGRRTIWWEEHIFRR